VYEPLIVLHGDCARETSRAAEQMLSAAPDAVCFHRACYDTHRSEKDALTG
jgi:hypothetical protein